MPVEFKLAIKMVSLLLTLKNMVLPLKVVPSMLNLNSMGPTFMCVTFNYSTLMGSKPRLAKRFMLVMARFMSVMSRRM